MRGGRADRRPRLGRRVAGPGARRRAARRARVASSRARSATAATWSARSRCPGCRTSPWSTPAPRTWPDGLGAHDLVTARALAALPVILEYAAPLLAEGGHVVAWKGAVPAEEVAAGAAAAAILGLEPRRGARRRRRYKGARDHTLHVLLQDRAHAGALPAPRRDGDEAPARLTRSPQPFHVKRGTGADPTDPAASVDACMGTIYAIANQKGGVGKTTTAVNVAACIAAAGYETLVVDVDPQGNATVGLGVVAREGPGVYDVLAGDIDARDAVRPTGVERLSILVSTPDLAGATMELPRLAGSETRLREALDPLRDALRLHPARLPAVARAADRQRAGRGRARDRAGADRVLRARGPRRAARHAGR